jgi:hypothetical protein
MIKKGFVFLAILSLLLSPLFSGVVKKIKSEVHFQKFGKFTSNQTMKISELKKMMDSDNTFKGKGIMGKLVGKFALKSGKTGEIVNLPEMMIYRVDHKKKEYRTEPITKAPDRTESPTETESSREDEEVETESDVKILRSEFKVDETGESKTINQFPSHRYNVNWIVEWENVRTGEKGTNRLSTVVWTTPLTGSVKECREEELNFSREHMKRMGLDLDDIHKDILGTNWLALFTQMNREDGGSNQDVPDFVEEMKKIEGYPVIIDGQYYATKQGGEAEEAEEGGQDVKRMFGKFAKKALKKSKKDDGKNPAFTYYTELKEFHPEDVGDEAFRVSSTYKKKG